MVHMYVCNMGGMECESIGANGNARSVCNGGKVDNCGGCVFDILLVLFNDRGLLVTLNIGILVKFSDVVGNLGRLSGGCDDVLADGRIMINHTAISTVNNMLSHVLSKVK